MKKIILLLCALLLTGCGYDPNIMPEDAYININKSDIKVFDNIYLYDLIQESNVEIITENKLIDTSIIGNNDISIKYKFNKRVYNYSFNIKIIDDIAPVFISSPSVKTYKVNTDANPCDEIVFGDNYDKEPTCIIDGNYDLNSIGTYNVKYVIKDNSDNQNTQNLIINVVNSISTPKSSNSNSTTLKIEDVINDKKNDNTMIGIDVSRFQEHIDFEQVKNTGIEFVIIRMGINSDIDKDISVDTYYKENIKNAKEAGLKVGIYVYTSAINNEMSLEHAKWTLEILDGEKLDFPIAYDWENWSKFRKYKISIHDLDDAFNTFAKTITDAGYDCMLYSSKFYLEKIWLNKNNYPVWLAHYTSKTNYEGDYIMWQMSNVGRVNGINGNVDIDIFYKK